MAGPQLPGNRRDACAIAAGRFEIARRHLFGRRIGRRLRHRRNLSPRVRAFMDWIAGVLEPYLD